MAFPYNNRQAGMKPEQTFRAIGNNPFNVMSATRASNAQGQKWQNYSSNTKQLGNMQNKSRQLGVQRQVAESKNNRMGAEYDQRYDINMAVQWAQEDVAEYRKRMNEKIAEMQQDMQMQINADRQSMSEHITDFRSEGISSGVGEAIQSAAQLTLSGIDTGKEIKGFKDVASEIGNGTTWRDVKKMGAAGVDWFSGDKTLNGLSSKPQESSFLKNMFNPLAGSLMNQIKQGNFQLGSNTAQNTIPRNNGSMFLAPNAFSGVPLTRGISEHGTSYYRQNPNTGELYNWGDTERADAAAFGSYTTGQGLVDQWKERLALLNR